MDKDLPAVHRYRSKCFILPENSLNLPHLLWTKAVLSPLISQNKFIITNYPCCKLCSYLFFMAEELLKRHHCLGRGRLRSHCRATSRILDGEGTWQIICLFNQSRQWYFLVLWKDCISESSSEKSDLFLVEYSCLIWGWDRLYMT